ncbi:hypothetical protein MUA02_04620 [Enterobacteriaceae bacterium H20N1]|uniref:Uncharacterized protein n=1 Tax=Dryocola boscaweniae TaxID=2925397 RepID=A0A9X3ABV4_9ENTR|nr:hypothetical protein [Dryocola boscaweniae]MCT4701163.1 hypothetical protein [Dryocola boscaweniae]MCT4718332.1 hypothetical protein [Dryocola boscaweniae]
MSNKDFIGILRFTSETYANELIAGQVYFGAAENYRHREDGNYMPGITDFNESCIFSYRSDRDSEPFILEFGIPNSDGTIPEVLIPIKTVTKFDFKKGSNDYWLSCWYSLFIKNDNLEKSIEQAQKEINDMRHEFGVVPVFIFRDDILKLVDLLKDKVDIRYGFVKYTSNDLECDVFTKRLNFNYQREYRFAIAGCPSRSKENKFVDLRGKADGLIKKINRLMIKDGEIFYM